MDREVDIPKDETREEIVRIIKTGMTQGINKEELISLLDLLEVMYVRKPPMYVPNAPDGWMQFRAGQVDIIKYLRTHCAGLDY